MNTSPPTLAAARAPASVAPALLERHKAALRSYVQALSRGDAAKVEAVVASVWQEAQTAENAEFEEDPTVWLFARARRRVIGPGQREALAGEAGSGPAEEEASAEGEEPRVVVHRTIGSLTAKQQETLRLKFQFHLNLDEIAAITGQARTGTAWLLHQAVVRIGKALGARDDDASPLASDPRVTAYALDEMDASERSYFEKGVVNGKALFERERAIRTWGGHITDVLSSGAPVPKRRRRKRAAAWWKSRAVWVGVALAAVAAVFWVSRRPAVDRNSRVAAPAPDSAQKPAGSVIPSPKESRANAPRTGVPASVAGHADNAKSLSSASHTGSNPAPDRNLDDEFFRPKAEPASPTPAVDSAPFREEPATPAAPRADTAAMFARKPIPGSTAPAGSEAVREIEVVGDQPGKGKPAEEVDAIPTLGALQRQLVARQWPRREQVRLGEMLKQVPKARGLAMPRPIEAHTELMRSPWDARKQIARVSVRAKDAPAPARGSANLVFAIDVSKSMAGPNRLPLVQEGVRRLVERLRPDDRISVVTYAEKADLALEAQPAERAAELRACLGGLEAAGRTNGSAGLRLAYATAHQHLVEGGLNVVVLCTDGNFNLGTTDEAALAALAAGEAAKGVRLSVFGFGRTDRNDLRLEVLATNGGGHSCYVNTGEEAERQLVEQIDGLFAPVARDVHLQVEFNGAAVADHRRIGDGPEQDTTGEVPALLPGRNVTALFEVTPKPAAAGPGGLGRLELAYVTPETGERQREVLELAATEQAVAKAGVEFKFAVAMAEFGRILRAGRPAETDELDRLEAWVRANLADDVGGYRIELLQNLALARALVAGVPTAPVAN